MVTDRRARSVSLWSRNKLLSQLLNAGGADLHTSFIGRRISSRMLGRYVDALPMAALKRIQQAARWRTHGYADVSGARCILGHAENWFVGADGQPHCAAPDVVACRQAAGDNMFNWPPLLGVRYDRLVERFGAERTVKLLKHRAAHDLLRKDGAKILVLS